MGDAPTTYSGLVFAVDSMFVVQDAELDPEMDVTPALLADSREHIAAGNDRIIVVQCIDASVRVGVDVEVWHTPPTGDDDPRWSPPQLLPLLSSSGTIYVDQTTVGPAAGLSHIVLPNGPGRYLVAVSHQGRDRLAEQLRDSYPRLSVLPMGDYQAALEELDGIERYRLRIWPEETGGAHG